MGEHVKLIAMTVFLTVLVWVAADQLLTESATLRVMIQPVAPAGGSLTVASLTDQTDTFQMGVSGPRRVISRLKEMDPLPLPLVVGAAGPGVSQVKVLEALDLRSGPLAGLNVTSVVPDFLSFVVDREVTLSVPVAVERGGLDYDVEPSIEPDHVTATLSELALADIPPEKRRVVLRADGHLRSRPKGVLLDFEVPLEAKVGGLDARISPSQVRLRATLREQRTTATISAVPIRFEGSADLLNDFRIELRDSGALLTQSITVKGSPEAISRLASGDLKITGVIPLTREDALDSTQYRFLKPVFHLPPGVEMDDQESVPGVEFRLVRNRPPS